MYGIGVTSSRASSLSTYARILKWKRKTSSWWQFVFVKVNNFDRKSIIFFKFFSATRVLSYTYILLFFYRAKSKLSIVADRGFVLVRGSFAVWNLSINFEKRKTFGKAREGRYDVFFLKILLALHAQASSSISLRSVNESIHMQFPRAIREYEEINHWFLYAVLLLFFLLFSELNITIRVKIKNFLLRMLNNFSKIQQTVLRKKYQQKNKK